MSWFIFKPSPHMPWRQIIAAAAVAAGLVLLAQAGSPIR